MARKNLFEVAHPASPDQPPDPVRKSLGRPLVGLDRPAKPAAAVGAISQSLETLSTRAHRAEEIEKRLAAGQAIVELDPDIIDASIVADRLEVDRSEQAALVAQIREHGQQVPILIRPHPDRAGRFQVAYGHRRLAAIKEIGGKIRAVVRELTDEQLVVSQGQENNSRTDLSYIERCYFAHKLQEKGFSREIIMAALGVDKAALSRMIALASRMPPELIEAVGPAPSIGRQRWAELADLLEERGKMARALGAISENWPLAHSSDERFAVVFNLVKSAAVKPKVKVWSAPNGGRAVKITESEGKLTLSFDKRIEPNFGTYVQERLEELYDGYKSQSVKE